MVDIVADSVILRHVNQAIEQSLLILKQEDIFYT